MSRPSLSLGRKLAYATLVTGFVLVIGLLSLEGLLRLAGYGASTHFARRETLASGEQVWRDNRDCTVPFFGREKARRPVPFRLPLKKEAGTYRVFILGSSAAMGDPEPSFSLARTLEQLLREAHPTLKFEVINAGITAINSNLLRGIAEDCATLEPDLFIVYEGNNEVIGPFGPSGVFAPFLGSERALDTALWLKSLRTGQLISQAWLSLPGKQPSSAEWGGMQMFLKQQIRAEDPRLETVAVRLQANLIAIGEAARKAGASTLFCTVLTNQRDFAPFMSSNKPGLDTKSLASWQAAYLAAIEAAKAGRNADAENAFRQALAIDDSHAELNFRLGRLCLADGRPEEARRLLARAQDLDTLRFRTDSRLNEAIRGLASAAPGSGRVVDLAATLGSRAAKGIPGDDLLHEHVHLTFKGTYDVACELLPQIQADLARRGLVKETPAPMSYELLRQRLAFTVYEQAMIQLSLLNRYRAAPFTGQSDNAMRISLCERRYEQAIRILQSPGALDALKALYNEALTRSPADWVLQRNAGSMLLARSAPAEALPLLKKAEAWISDDIDVLVALGKTHQALGNHTEAEAVFTRARKLEPNYPGLPPKAGLQ